MFHDRSSASDEKLWHRTHLGSIATKADRSSSIEIWMRWECIRLVETGKRPSQLWRKDSLKQHCAPGFESGIEINNVPSILGPDCPRRSSEIVSLEKNASLYECLEMCKD